MIRKLVALALVAIWPAVTSHILLESLDLIHVAHDHHHHPGERSHEHNEDHHLFADGDYVFAPAGKLLSKPVLSAHWTISALISTFSPVLDERVDAPGPAPPDSEPHFLQQHWHFSLRTAVPVRAPSSLS